MGKCKLPNSNEMMKYMSSLYIGFVLLQRVFRQDTYITLFDPSKDYFL